MCGSMRTMYFYFLSLLINWFFLCIGSVHPSESGTIAAFQGEKGESQLDEKGNVYNTFNQLLTCRIDIYSPFRPLSLSWIPIRSVALVAILALHASNWNASVLTHSKLLQQEVGSSPFWLLTACLLRFERSSCKPVPGVYHAESFFLTIHCFEVLHSYLFVPSWIFIPISSQLILG